MENYSLSDIAAATGEGGFGGNSWIVLILLFAMIYGGGGGLFGNNGDSAVQRAVDLNSIKEGQAALGADIQRGINEVNATTKDSAYNNLSQIRDVESAVNLGFANQQKCCCETLRAIDGVNYNISQSTASINENTTAQTQRILDAMNSNRIADLERQLQTANIANMMAGVVKYPMASTYTSGANPFCAGQLPCSCGV